MFGVITLEFVICLAFGVWKLGLWRGIGFAFGLPTAMLVLTFIAASILHHVEFSGDADQAIGRQRVAISVLAAAVTIGVTSSWYPGLLLPVLVCSVLEIIGALFHAERIAG